MSKDASFDVVSDFDPQEMVNALDQTRRDIAARFDLKDSGSTIEQEDAGISIHSTDEFRIKNIVDILEAKLIKRGISPQVMDPQPMEAALGGKSKQLIKLKKGIDTELAKKIVAEIKNLKLKVQASIQGDQVRVSGKNRDDLQAVIAHLKQTADTWGIPLQYNNFR
jgi:cyclic-di-GMP-binding protein